MSGFHDQLDEYQEEKFFCGVNGRMHKGACSRAKTRWFCGFNWDCFAAALEHASTNMISLSGRAKQMQIGFFCHFRPLINPLIYKDK